MQQEAQSPARIREKEMSGRLEEMQAGGEILISGQTSISDNVIAAIVGVAASEIEGIASLGTSSVRRTISERLGGAERRTRGVAVEVGKKEAILDIEMRVIYGYNIPNMIVELRSKVASRLLDLTALRAKAINISVVDLEFPERMPGRLQ